MPTRQGLKMVSDHDWRDFVKAANLRITQSNNRVYRAVLTVKGKQFANDLAKANKVCGGHTIHITRTADGVWLKDNRWVSFPRIAVQNSTNRNGHSHGYMYMPIDEKRFAKLFYTL